MKIISKNLALNEFLIFLSSILSYYENQFKKFMLNENLLQDRIKKLENVKSPAKTSQKNQESKQILLNFNFS